MAKGTLTISCRESRNVSDIVLLFVRSFAGSIRRSYTGIFTILSAYGMLGLFHYFILRSIRSLELALPVGSILVSGPNRHNGHERFPAYTFMYDFRSSSLLRAFFPAATAADFRRCFFSACFMIFYTLQYSLCSFSSFRALFMLLLQLLLLGKKVSHCRRRLL